MSKVIDFFDNTPVKLFSILSVNDNIKTIKEKIFISYNLEKKFITPNIIAISNGKKYITTDIDIVLDNIFVYSLIDELTRYIFVNINLFLDINSNSKILNTLYSSLKNIYIDLTKKTLLLVIQFILSSNTINVDIYKNDLNIWFNNTKQLQQQLIEKYSIITQFISKEQYEKYLFLDKHGNFEYSLLNSNISYIISDDKLDILKIIREYPLDMTVPIMITSNYPSPVPIIKIYKKFPQEQLSEWFIKGKQNDNILIKRPKGLTLKLKTNDNDYSTVIVLKDKPKISIRCTWMKENKAKLKDIKICTRPMESVIKKINNIFPNIGIKLGEPTISFINFQFNTKKKILLSKIYLAVKYFKGIFSIDEELKKKEFLKLLYIPDNNTIIIRYSQITVNKEILQTNSFDVLAVNTEKQIYTLIQILYKLIARADTQKNVMIFKDFEFVNIENTSDEPLIPNKANIKKLKKEGVSISAISCQKKRQPIISDKPPLPNSYALNYKNNRFICTNKPFIFPGFTNKNIICCFQKDQRDKDIYKRNIGTIIKKSSIDDKAILKSNIIITDKILDKNRIGLLPKIFYNFFDSSFYRLGIFQDNTSLLTLLNTAFNKSLSIDDLYSFIENNPYKINYDIDLLDYIENKRLDNEIIGDVLSSIFQVNIIVFNIESNKLSCKELLHLPYKNYIFIIKYNNLHYELIVSKTSPQTLKKIFIQSDKITETVLNLYKRSCLTKYVGYPSPPMNFAELINNNITIISQIVNDFNNVSYVLTKSLGLVPVIPTKPISNIKHIKLKNAILNASDQLKLISTSKIHYIQPTGQIINNDLKTVGIVTNSGLIIPTKPSSQLILPIIYRQFIPNIDELLYNQVPSLDKRYTYMLSVSFYKELYNRFKYTLSKNIKDLKDDIVLAINSITDTQELHKYLKNTINDILITQVTFIDNLKPNNVPTSRNVCSELSFQNCSTDIFCKNNKGNCSLAVEKQLYNNFINKLAIEIVWNKDILSNNIKKEFIGKNNFLKRKNEVVLLTEEDISKFFKI